MSEYVIVFPSSSFFMAAYARDRLQQAGIPTHPDEDTGSGSCGHGITLITNEEGIEHIKAVLRQNQINWRAIFRLRTRGILRYKAI